MDTFFLHNPFFFFLQDLSHVLYALHDGGRMGNIQIL